MRQVASFSERGWRVAALDVRGYGGSSSPTEVERYTLRELASDVAAVAAELDDDPVVLFGHDWGAPIASHAAIRHPTGSGPWPTSAFHTCRPAPLR